MVDVDDLFVKRLILHWAFIVSCLIYAVVGFVLKNSGAISIKPVIPANMGMLALFPGVACAFGGIMIFRKIEGKEEIDRMKFTIVGCALVEFLAINALLLFLLTGGEAIPFYTGIGLAVVVLLLNLPRRN